MLTFNPNFSFGGDTTTASQSAASSAVGLTGGDSIFGGDGSNDPDTYVYEYTPGVDGDNLVLAAGTALNDDGIAASGIAGGGTDTYNVFANWPFTSNVSGGDTTFALNDGQINIAIDQNAGGAGSGDEWIFLGTADLVSGTTYTLTQTAGANTFVSMRAAAILFEPVPEPGSLALLGLGGLAMLRRRTV